MKKFLKPIICSLIIAIINFCPTLINAGYSADEFVNSGSLNRVIEDNDFVAINSMTESQIQEYLVSNSSYLKDFQENGRSAARIIYEASHGLYDAAIGSARGVNITAETGTISPRLILVYLQKEQSLITKTNRDDYALTYAMGYDCPDATGCSGSRHPGFAEQVGWGAWQLRYNFEIAKRDQFWWAENYGEQYYVGITKTFNDWNGTRNVTLSNAATSSIYRYTPHVFDSAYNVWKFYNTWSWPQPPTGGADPPPAPPPKPIKPGDINNDDQVDILDLSIFSNNWEVANGENKADLNNNGTVDIEDLSIMAANWGK